MKTYQKHKVTVEGKAIAITSEFILDVFRTFDKVDSQVEGMVYSNRIVVQKDANNGVKELTFTDDARYIEDEVETLVDTWHVLYRILKTTSESFVSRSEKVVPVEQPQAHCK